GLESRPCSIRRDEPFRGRYRSITNVKGSGLGAPGSGLGARNSGLGFQVLGSGFQVLGLGSELSLTAQRNSKSRAVTGFRLGRNHSTMRLDDCLDKAEPQTESTLGPALVATKQPLPDMRQFVGRNTDAGIADAEQTAIPLGQNPDEHLSACRRVFDRVV